MSRQTIFPLAALAALLAAVPSAGQTGATVAGQLLDATTGQPVDGVAVRVFPRETPVAGAGEPDGRFLLRLPPGQYTLWYLRDGYEAVHQSLVLRGDTALEPVSLSPVAARGSDRRGVRISGVVVDGATGAPLDGAVLEAVNAGRRAGTDTTGRFTLERVPVGEDALRVRRLGYHADMALLDVGTADAALGLLVLERDAIVLDGLKVTVDRLDRRVRSTAYGARVIRAEQIARVPATSAADLVRRRAVFSARPCGGSDPRWEDCMRVRGAIQPVYIYLDETVLFGGLYDLRSVSPGDIGRIEVYRGGSMVRLFTHGYLEQAARSRSIPMPLVSPQLAWGASTP